MYVHLRDLLIIRGRGPTARDTVLKADPSPLSRVRRSPDSGAAVLKVNTSVLLGVSEWRG
jgi:hypothetical protein